MAVSVLEEPACPSACLDRRADRPALTCRDAQGETFRGLASETHPRVLVPVAILLLALLGAHPSFAGSADPLRPKGIEANLAVAWFDYEEPGLMREYGFLPGIGVRARFRPDAPGIVLDAQAELFGGVLTYDGEYQDGTPLTADTVDMVTEERGTIGYDLLGRDWRVTPYLGLGYRYWFDRVQVSGGYRREIRYLFAPMGLEAAWKLDRSAVVGMRGEYDLFLQGWVSSHLSDVSASWDDAENGQDFGSGHGVRGAAFATWPIGQSHFLTLEAFARYWWVGDSKRTIINGPDDPDTTVVEQRYYVWEPKNETLMLGLALSLAF